MAALGDAYFETIPQKDKSVRVICVIYKGPNNGVVRKNDTIDTVVKKLVTVLKNSEKRIKALE